MKKFLALAVALFLGFAVLYGGFGAGARGRHSSKFLYVKSRTPEKSKVPLAERKTLKRALYVEGESLLSDPDGNEYRDLSPKERRGEIPDANFRSVPLFRVIHAPKVSTNLFLSVLNL